MKYYVYFPTVRAWGYVCYRQYVEAGVTGSYYPRYCLEEATAFESESVAKKWTNILWGKAMIVDENVASLISVLNS